MNRTRLIAASALLLTACSFRFDPQSLVKYRRILAIQADPAEIIVTDGHELATPIMLTALVVDPSDDGTAVPYVWRNCVEFLGASGQWDARGQRCMENDATLTQQVSFMEMPIGAPPSGSTPLTVLGSAPVAVSLPNVLDALTGGGGMMGGGGGLGAVTGLFDGVGTKTPAISLWVDMMLRVGEGDTALYGIKRIVVSPDVPVGRKPNQIPHVIGLLFDGKPWHPTTPLSLPLDACDGEKKVEIPNLEAKAGDPQSFKVCRHTITPVFDPSQSEAYVAQTFDRDSTGAFISLSLKERMRFQWHTDRGSMDQNETEEPDTYGIYDYDPISVHWDEPHAPKESGATMWVVMKDGRGGESWEIRKIAFAQ